MEKQHKQINLNSSIPSGESYINCEKVELIITSKKDRIKINSAFLRFSHKFHITTVWWNLVVMKTLVRYNGSYFIIS